VHYRGIGVSGIRTGYTYVYVKNNAGGISISPIRAGARYVRTYY
jgi:hypothetical protein